MKTQKFVIVPVAPYSNLDYRLWEAAEAIAEATHGKAWRVLVSVHALSVAMSGSHAIGLFEYDDA